MYCTTQDLIDTFGRGEIEQLSQRDGITGGLNQDVINKAMGMADSEINVYLEGRYTLPLPTVPLIVKQIAADLARYYLHTRIDDDHPVAKRYLQRIRLLAAISSGKCALGLDDNNKVAQVADTVQIAPGRSVFGGGDW